MHQDVAMDTVAPTRETRLSAAIEDYVKTIYLLHQEHERVTTSVLARQLGVAPASVSGMIHKLAKLNLVTHIPYRGVVLTDVGQRTALGVLRRHRLLELFLVEALGYSWDEVHAEAEVLEHVISETLEARIAERLGHPTADPHGDPIPFPDLTVPLDAYEPLVRLPVGSHGHIVRVIDQEPAHLRYLQKLGLVPGTTVTVYARAPFDGPLTIGIRDTVHAIDSRMACSILVRAPEEEGAG
jgi:DtxR family Mn-dependent transcriptional regulator